MPSLSSPVELPKNRPFEVFEPEDINELLLMIYVHLQIALRYNSNMLVLNMEELKHVTDEGVVERFTMPFDNASMCSAFRENLLKIFERHDLVKQYFQLDHADDDSLIVRMIKSSTGHAGSETDVSQSLPPDTLSIRAPEDVDRSSLWHPKAERIRAYTPISEPSSAFGK